MPEPGAEQRAPIKARYYNPKNPDNPFQRKVILSEADRQAVELELGKFFSEWDSGSSVMRSQLQRWLANSEGISTPTGFPWPHSSQIFKPITETRQNIVHSFLMSVIRPRIGRLFQFVTDERGDKDKVAFCKKFEAYINTENDFNKMYVMGADEAAWAWVRDGTIWRELGWEKRTERRWEAVRYEKLNDFVNLYPSPDAAGLSDGDYQKVIEKLAVGEPAFVDEEFDETVVDRPFIGFQELKDSVWFPLNAKGQKNTIFVGYRFWLRGPQIRAMAVKDKIFDKAAVDAVLKNEPVEASDVISNLQSSIEGIQQTTTKTQYPLIHGRYLKDLDGDGVEEKYLVTFAVDEKKLLQIDRYPYYHGNDFLQNVAFKKRPKRLVHRGIAQMLDDLNEEANIAARQRIDARAITNSPMFLAVDALKSTLDLNRPENKFRPGGVWYVPQMFWDKIKEVVVQKRDLGDSMNEENAINQASDNVLGASELRSGRETPLDPRSPAAKTAMLLNQSAARLDDFVYNFIMAENEILNDIPKLYAQFGPPELVFWRDDGQGGFVKDSIPTALLKDKSLHLRLSFTSMMDNPEFLKATWEEFYMKYGPEPLIGNIPEVRWNILDQIVTNMPEATGKSILLPLQEILQRLPAAPPPGGAAAPGGGGPAVPSKPPVNPTLAAALSSPRPSGTL